MAIFKRGKWFWTDFSVNGQRFRQPLRTEEGLHIKYGRLAKSREKDLIADAKQGKLAASNLQFAKLSFSEAVDRYIGERLARIQPNTARAERERAKQLKKYFGVTPVARLSTDSILAYIAE